MQLLLEGERRIRLDLDGSAELSIDAGPEGTAFSPLHMLAASLATCTASVLLSWAEQASLATDGLTLTVDWEYVEDPYRVGGYRMALIWPGLPERRRAAALRVAEQCTVEQTLRLPTPVETRFEP